MVGLCVLIHKLLREHETLAFAHRFEIIEKDLNEKIFT